jgi:hypothetical protein
MLFEVVGSAFKYVFILLISFLLLLACGFFCEQMAGIQVCLIVNMFDGPGFVHDLQYLEMMLATT